MGLLLGRAKYPSIHIVKRDLRILLASLFRLYFDSEPQKNPLYTKTLNSLIFFVLNSHFLEKSANQFESSTIPLQHPRACEADRSLLLALY